MKILTPLNLRRALRKFYYILNIAQPRIENRLTDSEVNLIAEFSLLPERYQYHRFSYPAKKQVQQALKEIGWKISLASIRTKIYSMLDKQVLYRENDGVIYLNPSVQESVTRILKSYDNDEEFEITFVLKPERTLPQNSKAAHGNESDG